jgi:hypothetical protein
MTSRVSELSALGDGLSCESATHNAKAVAARGLQKAEETRAAAAGAEAEALKVGGGQWPTVMVVCECALCLCVWRGGGWNMSVQNGTWGRQAGGQGDMCNCCTLNV